MPSVFFRHASIALAALLFLSGASAQEGAPVVTAGKTVGFEYTMRLADGTVVESNVGGEPFSYVHGQRQIFPVLEAALEGMAVDESKSFSVKAADAYGPIDPDAFKEVPIENIPEESRHADALLNAEGFDGPIRVDEVREKTVVLDFNNPLAGKDLIFEVRVVSIE